MFLAGGGKVAKSRFQYVLLPKERHRIGMERPGTRELVASGTPYVIPYRVKGDWLELIAVFHGKQEWPERL